MAEQDAVTGPPPGMGDEWYYYHEGEGHGPVAWHALAEMVERGDLHKSVGISCTGDEPWLPFSYMQGWRQPSDDPAPPPKRPFNLRKLISGGESYSQRTALDWGWDSLRFFWRHIWVLWGAMLIGGAVTLLSAGVCGPPMWLGYYGVCLKACDERPVRARDVLGGLRMFWPAWGTWLTLVGLTVVPFILPVGLMVGLVDGYLLGVVGHVTAWLYFGMMVVVAFVVTAWWQVAARWLFFVPPLVVDRGLGPIAALRLSKSVVQRDSPPYASLVFYEQIARRMMPFTEAQVIAYRQVFRGRRREPTEPVSAGEDNAGSRSE